MQKRLPTLFPIRYTALLLCALGLLWAGVLAAQRLQAGLALGWPTGMALALCALLVLLGLYDLIQPHHAILRNYPVIGHLRYMLEDIRPEIRQYFIEGDREAEPFSRAQRSLVYQRAKGEPDNRPFGTLLDVSDSGYEWINHSLAPTRIAAQDFRVWVGGTPQQPSPSVSPCTQPYAMSVFNISAMSFGALSANAILALNQGAKIGGFAHDTGEGSISRYHRVHGGDLVWEIASGYFGCRNADGSFNPERFAEQAHAPQVKMIELKLSQGAKPGQGGMLLGPRSRPRSPRRAAFPPGRTASRRPATARLPRPWSCCSSSHSCARSRAASPRASSSA